MVDIFWNESQEMLRNAARDFMNREAPKDVIVKLQSSETGTTPELWKTIADLGWLGMMIPEQYGGGGSSVTDAAALFEELGRGPLPGPIVSSGVLGAQIVFEAGTEEQKKQILPEVTSGRQVLALAMTEPDYGWGADSVQMAAKRNGNSYALNGTKVFVADAAAATHLITPVRTGKGDNDVSLLLVDRRHPGVSVRNLEGFLGWQAEVVFKGVEVPAANLLGGAENKGWPALGRALEKTLPVLCSYMVGGCQAVFEMSVGYSQTRIVFGTPIGRFSRVADHIVRLVNHLDGARWTTYEALWNLDKGRPASASVHLAKAVSSEAYWEACNAAHEVHAGIGTDLGYGLTVHTQMSRTMFHYLGDPKWHKRRMADVLEW